MKSFFLFLAFFCLLVSPVLEAESATPPMPPFMANFKTGTLGGTLYLDDHGKKKPIANQELGIVAFQNGQQVLMLHKKTDEKGKFFFSRIIKDPQFEFALGVIVDQIPYVITGIQMAESEEHLELDFPVGENSPYKLPPEQAFHGEMAAGDSAAPVDMAMPSAKPMGEGIPTVPENKSYQQIAIFLSVVVVALAFVFSLGGGRAHS